MLSILPSELIVGTVLGLLAGLGVGGGSLLILWLTLVLGMDHGTARTINLLFFLPTATISSIFRLKQGALDYRKILPGIVFGCLSAALFAALGKQLDSKILQKMFGLLLLFTGLKELLYRPKD